MADITMCVGEKCPDKLLCYRYTAPANPWRQSCFMETPWKPGEECVQFSPNSAGQKLSKLRKIHKGETK